MIAGHNAVTFAYRWGKPVSDQMKVLCEEHGINSFMMYLCDQYQLNDSELYDLFTLCKDLGALAEVHAENGDIIAKNQEKLIAKGVTGKFQDFFPRNSLPCFLRLF